MSVITPLTFELNDKLGLKPFSEKLEKFLLVEHDFVEGSLVVSLNAVFGSGKSTFLSMWKSDFDKRRETAPAIPKAIIINAWESDYCGEPLLSIVNALIKAADGEDSAKESGAAHRIREAAKDVGWFFTGLANKFASDWSGIDPMAAGKVAQEKRQVRQTKIPDFIKLYEDRQKSLDNLKVVLREVFGGEQPKAFLFIDELDRCRPDYAINYLETIKHVFDIHGLVFVLAVDYDQLSCSARALFGSDMKFSEYFRKFSQRNIALPEPNESNLRTLAFHYTYHYLEREGKRVSFMRIDEYRVGNIVELITALKMTPRQIQEMFRTIGHTVAGETANRGTLYWCIGVGVILMAALKISESEFYRQIGKGVVNDLAVGKYFIKLLGKKKADWWFSVYLTGTDGREDQNKASIAANIQKLFKDLEFVEQNSSFDIWGQLGQFSQGWGGHSNDRWKQIYQTIEAANKF